jgi:branched-chain amino acid transport system ATP-binding protein
LSTNQSPYPGPDSQAPADAPATGAPAGNLSTHGTALLSVRGLSVHHGQLRAVADLDLDVAPGETVAVIGANGAGKSTLLAALAGTLRPSAGTIHYDGRDITGLPAHRRVAAGICLVPEGRRLFPSLTVEENLLTGTYCRRPGPWTVDAVMELFPWMRERRDQGAVQLSGGEQQAVAIGRALVGNPRLLLLDEVSLGLAPAIVQRIYGLLPQIVHGGGLEQGTSVLLVEQDVSQALKVADRVHCLLEGRVALTGRPGELTAEQVEAAYFGLARARGGATGGPGGLG